MIEQRADRRWWPVAIPIVLIAIAISLLFPAGRHQWALSIVRQPTHYTTLAFDRAWALPATAVQDERIKISFSIANNEGRAIKYRYLLTQSGGGTAQTLTSAAKLVGVGETWNVSTSVRPSCGRSPCRIEVSLPGRPEEINFLVYLYPKSPVNG